jgi:hypothetical protein
MLKDYEYYMLTAKELSHWEKNYRQLRSSLVGKPGADILILTDPSNYKPSSIDTALAQFNTQEAHS